MFLFLQLGSSGSHSVCWFSHRAVEIILSILSSVVTVPSLTFGWSRLFMVNNGWQPAHGINWLANHQSAWATSLWLCTTGPVIYLWWWKAIVKAWQSGQRYLAKWIWAILRMPFESKNIRQPLDSLTLLPQSGITHEKWLEFPMRRKKIPTEPFPRNIHEHEVRSQR